jgi:type I restriction enzyme S subunit
MKGWIRKTIGEICDEGGGEVKTGPFGAQLHESDYQEFGTPVVMPTDIRAGKISTRRVARVSDNHVDRLYKHKLSVGDIVYGRRGDIGRQALVRPENEGWLCGTGCLRLSLGNSIVVPEYLHRYLATPDIVGWIEGQAVGATMPNLNTAILRRVPIYFPKCLRTQKKIAAILSTYDDLIDNNQRRIVLLEKIAEELYREWFVRLRFPAHEKTNFEKGIPKKWGIKCLGEILELCYGKALKEEDRVPGPYAVYGSSGIVGTHHHALAAGPGIIVGRKGNVGSVHWSDENFFAIDTAYFVRSDINSHYLFFLLQSMNFLNSDAAVPGLNRTQAYANKILLPPAPIIDAFTKNVIGLFDLKKTLSEQINFLTATRDQLLNRLISGKLSVESLDIHFPPSMQEAANDHQHL